VIESYYLVLAACFSEREDCGERPCLLVLDLVTGKILQRVTFKEREYPSAIAWHVFESAKESPPQLKVYVGASLMANTQEGETESYSPQKGTLYSFIFDVELRHE